MYIARSQARAPDERGGGTVGGGRERDRVLILES